MDGNWHFQSKILKRSQNKNAVAAAAYRAGEALTDDATGRKFDYTRRQKIIASQIIAPENAAAWVQERGQLWNTVEATEKRKDAQLARELEIAIPDGLALEISTNLVWEFCQRNFASVGMVADVAIHGPGKGDTRNVHAHIMLTMRHLSPNGFGGKAREWNDNAQLDHWKADWLAVCNAALQAAKSNVRLDRRSLEQRRQEQLDLAKSHPEKSRERMLAVAEAARLDYTPRPHLPQKIFRAMQEGKEVPPEWAEKIRSWHQAVASKKLAEDNAREIIAHFDQQEAVQQQKEREARQMAAQQRAEAEARKKAELEAQKAQQEAKQRAEAEARKKAEQKARKEAFTQAVSTPAKLWGKLSEKIESATASWKAAQSQKSSERLRRLANAIYEGWVALVLSEVVNRQQEQAEEQRAELLKLLKQFESSVASDTPDERNFTTLREDQAVLQKALEEGDWRENASNGMGAQQMSVLWGSQVRGILELWIKPLRDAIAAPRFEKERAQETEQARLAEESKRKKIEAERQAELLRQQEYEQKQERDRARREQQTKEWLKTALPKYGPCLDQARQHPEAKKYLLERWNIDIEHSNHWLLSIIQDQDFWLKLDKDVEHFIWRITPVASWGPQDSPKAPKPAEEAKAQKAKPAEAQEPSSKPKPVPRGPTLGM